MAHSAPDGCHAHDRYVLPGGFHCCRIRQVLFFVKYILGEFLPTLFADYPTVVERYYEIPW